MDSSEPKRRGSIQEWTRECALTLPETTFHEYRAGFAGIKVGGKWFAVFIDRSMPVSTLAPVHTDKPVPSTHASIKLRKKTIALVNLTGDPDELYALRKENVAIKPAYHMNKEKWVSIYPERGISREMVENLVIDSYLTIWARLPKKRRPVLSDDLTIFTS